MRVRWVERGDILGFPFFTHCTKASVSDDFHLSLTAKENAAPVPSPNPSSPPTNSPTSTRGRQRVLIRASDFVRGVNIAVGECGNYGTDVILNAAPCTSQPNAAKYDFNIQFGDTYEMIVEYATPFPPKEYR